LNSAFSSQDLSSQSKGVDPHRFFSNRESSSEGLEQVPLHSVSDLGQVLLHELQKISGAAMGLQRCVVPVLFIDEETAALRLVPVHLKHAAARFLARFLGKLRKKCGYFGFEPRFRHPGYRENDHRSLLIVRNQLGARF
jgi:hypothetical protein